MTGGTAPRRLALLIAGGLHDRLQQPAAAGRRSGRPAAARMADRATPPRAVILGVHGFNDYSNAFAEFGAYAAGRGIAVHAYDQPGFGANPDAGLWPGIPALVASLVRERARLAAALSRAAGLPARREHGGRGADRRGRAAARRSMRPA